MDQDKIFSATRRYLSDYQLKFPVKESKLPTVRAKWSPPLGEMYRTNYDGAVFEDLEEARIGVIGRNDRGEVLAALSEKIPYPGSVVLVEVQAARRAV